MVLLNIPADDLTVLLRDIAWIMPISLSFIPGRIIAIASSALMSALITVAVIIVTPPTITLLRMRGCWKSDGGTHRKNKGKLRKLLFQGLKTHRTILFLVKRLA